MKPSFLIIGAQKGGTTSLYHYLLQHPQVLRCRTKEVQFFDHEYWRGWGWYRAHFPRRLGVRRRQFHRYYTGEASPNYIYHPDAPRRIARTLPNVKLIVMLRNPVDRAYSHYQMVVRQGLEPLTFEEALDREIDRVGSDFDRFLRDPAYHSREQNRCSYLTRGHYASQLASIYDLFSEKQFLIIRSEDFFADPQRQYGAVLNFLGLTPHVLNKPQVIHAGNYIDMREQTRTRLLDYFRPLNKDLYCFLNRDFDWDV